MNYYEYDVFYENAYRLEHEINMYFAVYELDMNVVLLLA